MAKDITRFTLLPEHLLLLKAACIGWQDCEYGAPEINPKRPYGSSTGDEDVCRVLGWEKLGDDGYEPCFSSKQNAMARKLHKETEIALQIVLQTQSFVPGEYERPLLHGFYPGKWRLKVTGGAS